jgi:ribonuclease G
MNQRLLITRDRFQTRVALFEEGRLVEYFHEPSFMEGLVGNLYVGRVNRIVPGMGSAFVDVGLDRDGFLFEGDMGPAGFLDGNGDGSAARKGPFLSRLREGDRVLVQISKEPMGPKGARLSSQISLPGHYAIFMPCIRHLGVSRKVDGGERGRLREMLRRIVGNFDGGFIVRTAAEDVEEEDLAQDLQSLIEMWALVRMRAARSRAPALVHQEADAVGRAIREILLKGEGSVITDDPEIAARCRVLMGSIGQDPSRVDLRSDARISLFDHLGVDEELEKALRPKVWLPSGGCIVIQSTEALVSIDVNSGRYMGKKSLEETAFAINMEAASEVVRQLRLRSLGGIVVIDFIDMGKRPHREALLAKLTEELKRDRAKSRILNISEFGLVEMTRKRSHRNLERVMTNVCPCCDGRGRLAAAWRIAQGIARDLDARSGPGPFTVAASPDVVRYIEENREELGIPPAVRLEPFPLHQPLRYEIRSGPGGSK